MAFGTTALPQDAEPVAKIAGRGDLRIPPTATHYTVGDDGPMVFFTFYSANGQMLGRQSVRADDFPEEAGDASAAAARAVPVKQGPKWAPWALLGGGVLIAGLIVVASIRPVQSNRRRRRRR